MAVRRPRTPTVLAAGFGELAAQLGARDLAGARDPVASVHAVLAAVPGDVAADVRQRARTRPRCEAFLPPAGPGRVLITSQNPHWPPARRWTCRCSTPDVAAGFLVRPHRRPGRAGGPGPGRRAGRAAAGAGAGRRLHPGHRRQPGRVPGLVPAAAGRAAGPRGARPGTTSTVATTWALAFDRLQQSAPAAAGLLRLLACCAPEPIPLRLLLQPRPGLAGQLGPEVAPVLVPLLEDPLAADDAIAALRRYSLVSPAADGLVSVHRLVQAVTARPDARRAGRRVAAGRRRPDRGRDPRRPEQPETWPRMRGAAAARPGGPRR